MQAHERELELARSTMTKRGQEQQGALKQLEQRLRERGEEMTALSAEESLELQHEAAGQVGPRLAQPSPTHRAASKRARPASLRSQPASLPPHVPSLPACAPGLPACAPGLPACARCLPACQPAPPRLLRWAC